MNQYPSQSLLSTNDPPTVRVINPAGASPFLLLGDHAGNIVPASLMSLGLPEADLTRHIAWDIGVAGLGAMLAPALDAVFVQQTYSRLVIDCNRSPDAGDAIPEVSDGTVIPGNLRLMSAERMARLDAIHKTYQTAIADEIQRRTSSGQETVIVSLHSFTPSLNGEDRPWEIGVLYGGGDTSFARAVLATLQRRHAGTVGDNAPYAMDGTDHTVPRHAFGSGLRYVELEIRQDLVATADQQAHWSEGLTTVLIEAANSIGW